MKKQILNVAIIGSGMVAKTHIAAIADLADDVKLVAIGGRDMAKLEKFKSDIADLISTPVELFDDIDMLAAMPKLDMAIILTPPNARKNIVDRLAKHKIAILMEKPIERNAAAAAEIVSTCKAQNAPLGIVFQHRLRPASVKAKELIASGQLGKLCIVDVNVPWWREQSYYDEPGRGTYARDGGGVLISQAIHSLDLMLSLCGPVASVQAMARTSGFHNMESEDFVSAGLTFENGAIGSLRATTAHFPGGAESLIMHFERAVLTLKAGQIQIDWQDGRVEIVGEDSTSGGGADPMAFTHDWHASVIKDFAIAVRNGTEPAINGQSALNVHYLIDALIKSSQDERAVDVEKLL